MSWKIRITCYLGLGGMRERYTTGETLWMIALSLGIGLLLGAVTILALVR
jgi:hypothetical protein